MSYLTLLDKNLSKPVICNSITSTDSSKMEGIQRKFAALCTYTNALQFLQQYNLHEMQFFINV
jgi:hypothetical protein